MANSRSVPEIRIGSIKATVWENEVSVITQHNVTFSRIYPDGGQWKTTHSFGFKNLLTLAKRFWCRQPMGLAIMGYGVSQN